MKTPSRLLAALLFVTAGAVAPSLVHYQGRLADAGGPVNGTVSLELRIFTTPTGGASLCTDSNQVLVVDGLYATFLGDNLVAGDLSWVGAAGDHYLEVAVNGAALAPRERISSVFYSLLANAVTDGAITSAMLGTGAVTAEKLGSGAVTAAKLAANAVTGAAVADGTLSGVDLSPDAIGSPALAKDYQSGSVPLVVPASGLLTNLVVSLPVPFPAAPVVTANLSTSGADALTASARVLTRTASNFVCRIETAPIAPPWSSAPVNVERGDTVPALMDAAALASGLPALVANTATPLLQFTTAASAAGEDWLLPTNIPTGGQTLLGLSLLGSIGGNPGVAWQPGVGGISYSRATNASGSTWPASPVTVIAAPPSNPTYLGQSPRLAMVGANPAIAYVQQLNSADADLRFVRASNATGSAWGAAVLAHRSVNALLAHPSLAMVGAPAQPAVVFQKGQALHYTRASNATGSSWSAALALDTSGNCGQHARLFVAGGQPAVLYIDQAASALRYLRANDANGTSWPTTPVTVVAAQADGPLSVQLDGEGNPFVVYFDTLTRAFRSVRSLDASGNPWDSAAPVSPAKLTAAAVAAVALGANPPLVAYRDSSSADVKSATAAAANLATGWNAPLTAHAGGRFARHFHAHLAQGAPAVLFRDDETGSLRFRRASNAAASVWSGSGVTVDGAGTAGVFPRATALNSGALLASHGTTGGQLVTQRNVSGDGASWAAAVTVDNVSHPDPDLAGEHTLLLLADGTPLAVYTSSGLQSLAADNPEGTAWTPLGRNLVTSLVTRDLAALLADGKPMVFAQATADQNLVVFRGNATGTAWTSTTLDAAGDTGRMPSAALVDGHPAVAYHDATRGDLRFVRAADAEGEAWPSPRTLEADGVTGLHPSLFILGGVPAIAHARADTGELILLVARDPRGDAWNAPVTLHTALAPTTLRPQAFLLDPGVPYIVFGDTTSDDLRALRTTSTAFNAALDWIAVEP